MALPEGAHYVRGTNRRIVRLADGTLVSRTTAENMAVAARGLPGITNTYQQRKLNLFKKTDRGQNLLQSRNHTLRSAEVARKRVNRPELPDQQIIDDLAALIDMTRDKQGNVDRSPDSALAHYLVAVGRRDPGADYAVGESPLTK